MVARIRQGKAIQRSFYYNENKVKEGVATLISAPNYHRSLDKLPESMRLGLLQKLASLRPNAKVNSLHISLNFDPSEKLDRNKLAAIAKDYMDKIGFGFQPYLVYEHRDSGHPHIHILTTNIEADGKRIGLHNLGLLKSEPARKSIEIEYGLIRAEDSTNTEKYRLEPITARALYGRTPTKKAIQNVLQTVLPTYKYGSLSELNALLKQYNVVALTGDHGTKSYAGKGVFYRVLDSEGPPIGTPIKASSFYFRPIWSYLEQQFAEHQKTKPPLRPKVRSKIDTALVRGSGSLRDLEAQLKKVGIDIVFRQNTDGLIYGITYVDHINKVVFNGSELGKKYSAKSLLEQCMDVPLKQAVTPDLAVPLHQSHDVGENVRQKSTELPSADHGQPQTLSSLFWAHLAELKDILLRAEDIYDPLPYQLRIGQKKKKKKKISR